MRASIKTVPLFEKLSRLRNYPHDDLNDQIEGVWAEHINSLPSNAQHVCNRLKAIIDTYLVNVTDPHERLAKTLQTFWTHAHSVRATNPKTIVARTQDGSDTVVLHPNSENR